MRLSLIQPQLLIEDSCLLERRSDVATDTEHLDLWRAEMHHNTSITVRRRFYFVVTFNAFTHQYQDISSSMRFISLCKYL